jgi:hypothetical protein
MALKNWMVTKTGMVVFGNDFYIGSSSSPSAAMVGDTQFVLRVAQA